SLPFTVATALVHGSVGLEHFSPEAMKDPRVLALAARCQYKVWEHADNAVAGALRLHRPQDRLLVASFMEPLGAPTRPLDDSRLLQKATDCFQRAARPRAAEAADAHARAWLDVAGCEDVGVLLQPA
ncbi:MAG: hypothetical protein RLZZ393_2307, partial [Pseudomonadota bacterium]